MYNRLASQMINAVTDIQEDTVVEVVINAQHLGEDDVEIRPHQLSIHSYKTPTFCHFCGEMLFGMFKQVRKERFNLNRVMEKGQKSAEFHLAIS